MSTTVAESSDATAASDPPPTTVPAEIPSVWEQHAGKCLAAILIVAVVLKCSFFTGFALGDDAYYANVIDQFAQTGKWRVDFVSDLRLSFYLPVALCFKLFGVNNIAYGLTPLIFSTLNILAIYFLARLLFDKSTGLLAALLLTFSPFDILYGTTMTIDIFVGLGSVLALYFFLRSVEPENKRWPLHLVASNLLFVYLYFVKMPALMFTVVIGLVALAHLRMIKRLLLYGLLFFAFIFLITWIEKIVYGEWLIHFSSGVHYHKDSAPDYSRLWDYGHWFFRPYVDGYHIFGIYFFLFIPAIILGLFKDRLSSYYMIAWLVGYFLLLNFFPVRIDPYVPIPRWFRYAYVLVPPGVILLAQLVRWLIQIKWTRPIGITLLLAVIGMSTHQVVRQDSERRDSLRDANAAIAFFDELPASSKKLPIYCDNLFKNYYFFHNRHDPQQIATYAFNEKVVWEIPYRERFAAAVEMPEGYLLTGGARSWWIVPMQLINRYGAPIPDEWELVKTIDLTTTRPEWKDEPMQIFRRISSSHLTPEIDYGAPQIDRTSLRKQVLIDNYHGFTDSPLALFLQANGYTCTTSTSPLTDEALDAAGCLLLTYHPDWRAFDEEEWDRIGRFLQSGGRLMMLAISWTYDKKYGAIFPYDRITNYFDVRFSTIMSKYDQISANPNHRVGESVESLEMNKAYASILRTFSETNVPVITDSAGNTVGFACIQDDARAVILGHCNFGFGDTYKRGDNGKLILNSIAFLAE